MAGKICLFTAHSPVTGGGAVILRSLTQYLPEYSFQWKYIANKPAAGYEAGFIGKPIMGGPLVQDVKNTWLMLRDKPLPQIDAVINTLLQIECDAYWVVSHNEGLRVAIELCRRQSRPVHLTIHDDWAGALSARSVRYRFLASLGNKMTKKAIQACSSVDVISSGMQQYYTALAGRNTHVCHRYLPPESVLPTGFNRVEKQLVAGHIGSLYSKQDFIKFLELLKQYGDSNGLSVTMKMWGYHPKKRDAGFPPHLEQMVQINDNIPEQDAIPELAKCDFVYAMYPFSNKLRIFSKTSLPTKLSTYVQSCRPIFAHGPAESTLASFIQQTGTGILWGSTQLQEGMEFIQSLMALQPRPADWENARQRYFGEKNLALLRSVFSK